MNLQDECCFEEEAADHLWRAISTLQAMTDRLLTQYEKTLRGGDADAHSLASLAAG